MHSRQNEGIGVVAKVFIFIFCIVVLFTLVIWATTLKSTPTLGVSNVSLNPHEISVNGSATLTFTIQNNDAANQHSANAVFNTTSAVTFYQNGLPLFRNSDEFQYLPITLQSSEQSTYPLKVTATLMGGASTSTYTIRIEFHNENSTIFDTETVTLKVDQ